MSQKIKCTVYDCKYNSPMEDECTLKKIVVRCCRGEILKESTMCSNYRQINIRS